jgi:repressor LexA
MNEMRALTRKQGEILEVIRRFIETEQYAPTCRELMDRLGMRTTSHVHYHLRKLREAGLITWTPRRARSIRVVESRQ